MSWHSYDMLYTWELSKLAVERPWSALAVPSLSLLMSGYGKGHETPLQRMYHTYYCAVPRFQQTFHPKSPKKKYNTIFIVYMIADCTRLTLQTCIPETEQHEPKG